MNRLLELKTDTSKKSKSRSPKTATQDASIQLLRRKQQKKPKAGTLDHLLKEARNMSDSLEILKTYLTTNEIPCYKYHFTVNGPPIVFDRYRATLKLSKDGKRFIMHNYKPEENFAAQERMAKLAARKEKVVQQMMEEMSQGKHVSAQDLRDPLGRS